MQDTFLICTEVSLPDFICHRLRPSPKQSSGYIVSPLKRKSINSSEIRHITKIDSGFNGSLILEMNNSFVSWTLMGTWVGRVQLMPWGVHWKVVYGQHCVQLLNYVHS